MNLSELIQLQPIVPYVRESDFPIREAYYLPFRRLLDYLLIYVRKGELTIVADGMTYRVEQDRFCLLQPGTIHDIKASSTTETPFVHLDFFYSDNRDLSFPTKPGQLDLSAYVHLMQPRLNDLEDVHLPFLLEPRQPALYRKLLFRVIESWLSPDPLDKLVAQAAGTELLLEIVRDHAEEAGRLTRSADTLQWVESYLSFHLAEPISVPDMAKRAHLSPSRFRDVFRMKYGMPPHQYLVQMRLSHAKELLSTTNFSLVQISEYCGFTDASHFSNAFKKAYGCSPGAYRKIEVSSE